MADLYDVGSENYFTFYCHIHEKTAYLAYFQTFIVAESWNLNKILACLIKNVLFLLLQENQGLLQLFLSIYSIFIQLLYLCTA